MSTTQFYRSGLRLFLDGALDWETDDVRAILLDDSYSFDPTHQWASDLTGELSGGGYGREALASKQTTYHSASDTWRLSADELSWAELTAPAVAACVLYVHLGADDSANPLICIQVQLEGGQPRVVELVAEPLTVRWSGGYVLSLSDTT